MSQRHKLTQVRVAASLMKCGTSRVWMDPTETTKIGAAITRADVRRLISSGAIRKLPAIDHGIAGKRRYQRAGSRKGSAKARTGRNKETWLKIVRPQRQLLNQLKPKLEATAYRKLYKMIKGGAFRSRAHMTAYVESSGLLKKVKQ
jgi:large subunit ribosomal protein L19e